MARCILQSSLRRHPEEVLPTKDLASRKRPCTSSQILRDDARRPTAALVAQDDVYRWCRGGASVHRAARKVRMMLVAAVERRRGASRIASARVMGASRIAW